MQTSIVRMLKELPWTSNGLSLTEQLALDIINKDGPIRMARVFHFIMTESEPLPFLGDIMFLSAIRPFWVNDINALTVLSRDVTKPPMLRELLEINGIGKELINGRRNWLELNARNKTLERWVGGIRITPGRANWYWSPEDAKPVLR